MFDAVAEGRPTLVLPDLIVAEATYVLGSARVEPSEAAGHLLGVLERLGVEVMDRASSATLSSCGAQGRLDVAVAYLAAPARRVRGLGVLSFDRDFDRVPGVTPVDPGRHGEGAVDAG